MSDSPPIATEFIFGSNLSRIGRQHGKEVRVVVGVAAPPVSQLGGVADDDTDPVADLRPAADGVGSHELADA
jgi:hypothetical protein